MVVLATLPLIFDMAAHVGLPYHDLFATLVILVGIFARLVHLAQTWDMLYSLWPSMGISHLQNGELN